MALPPPTGEQDRSLDRWAAGQSQVVSAAAGSGKSTLLLHAVRRAPESARVLILSYNRPLAVEMTVRLDGLESAGLLRGGVVAQAFTFHGLCTHLFGLTPDDTTMESTLDAVERGSLVATAELAATHVCVDEVQDMRPLHHRLLRAVLPARCVYLLVGDANQLLYDFEEPPASTVFMERPQDFFCAAGDAAWSASRLSVSFRLTPPVAALVNAVAASEGLAPVEAGHALEAPPLPRVVTYSAWQWGQRLVPLVLAAVAEARCPSEVGILARSVRWSQPLLMLVNALAARNVPVYVHSCDGSDARVRERKVCVCTWHASKGLQWPYTFVLGVDASSAARPLHVALTRAQRCLVVAHDSKAPHAGLLRALRDSVSADVDAATAQLVDAAGDAPCGAAPAVGGATGPRDVTGFAPRGAAAHRLHRLILDVGGAQPGTTSQPAEQVVCIDSVWEDVTDLLVDALLIEAERLRTGRCLRIEEMRSPARAPRAQRLARLMGGDRRRLVDTRLTDRDLVPPLAKYALHNFGSAKNPASPAEQAMRAAAGASAYAGFHHRANRLMASRWWDEELFAMSLGMLLEALPLDAAFDVVAALPPAGSHERPMYARVQARTARRAYRLVFCDLLTAAERVRAVVPMVLDPSIELCVLLNLRTGECQRLVLSDRAAFAAAMHEAQ